MPSWIRTHSVFSSAYTILVLFSRIVDRAKTSRAAGVSAGNSDAAPSSVISSGPSAENGSDSSSPHSSCASSAAFSGRRLLDLVTLFGRSVSVSAGNGAFCFFDDRVRELRVSVPLNSVDSSPSREVRGFLEGGSAAGSACGAFVGTVSVCACCCRALRAAKALTGPGKRVNGRGIEGGIDGENYTSTLLLVCLSLHAAMTWTRSLEISRFAQSR